MLPAEKGECGSDGCSVEDLANIRWQREHLHAAAAFGGGHSHRERLPQPPKITDRMYISK